jgi:hypothetical protein
MTDEVDRALAELDQLTGCEQLARPVHPLVEPEDRRRDPSPIWDYWYGAVPRRERRELLTFMAPAGGGIRLDQLAGELFCSIDNAFSYWRDAVQAVRRARAHARTAARTHAEQLADPTSELYADEWEQFDAEQLRRAELDIYGPQELARDLAITTALVHQWRKRGKLPPADLTVSKVPLWHVETLKGAGIL